MFWVVVSEQESGGHTGLHHLGYSRQQATEGRGGQHLHVLAIQPPTSRLGAGTAATGCRSCVLEEAKLRRFEPRSAADVNTLNTNRPIDAELAKLVGVALTVFAV